MGGRNAAGNAAGGDTRLGARNAVISGSSSALFPKYSITNAR